MTTDAPPALAAQLVVDRLLSAVVNADQVIATATAMKARLLDSARRVHEGASGAVSSMVAREFCAETALALRVPERTAGALIEESRILVDQLPRTLDALQEGDITPRHARIIVEQTRDLDDDERVDLETKALRESHRSTGDFARRVRNWRERRVPESAGERRRRAEADRSVVSLPGADGMGWLSAKLPAVELTAIDDRLDDTARALLHAGDPRTFAQLRADTLIDVLLGRDSDATGRYACVTPTVVLTIPALTVAGASCEPGELEGYGPVDAETAREVAADCVEFRRMLTDPFTGIRLAFGRERYRPSEDLRFWLRLRDRVCTFPACTRKAVACDLDHRTDWNHHGHTDDHNLAHLCRRHHMLKHHTGFSVRIRDDGTIAWTTPTGRRYFVRPEGTDPP
jgi:hypothetical protein